MNAWRKHVKETYERMKKYNKNCKLKDALKEASKTWKK